MNLDPNANTQFSGSSDVQSVPAENSQPPNRRQAEHERRKSSAEDSGSGRSLWAELCSKLFWVCLCGFVGFAIWKIGPHLIESYQFVVTKGRIRAEYENAVESLESDPLADVSKAFQLVAHRIRPSVVSIRCEKIVVDRRQRPSRGEGQGSGVVMDSNGYILTNAHVIEKADSILVTLYDKRQYIAQVAGVDTLTDLAVLKINATDLVTAQWGDSDKLKVGSMVWAVGSPFGLEYTVTSGIVSGKNRVEAKPMPASRGGLTESPHQELLQTDAAVNPGNSGGPLVDSQGKVIGINVSIVGEQFLGISFAIPSSIAKFVFDKLARSGTIERGFFGFDPDPIYQLDAERLGLPDFQGALVNTVQRGSPAHAAGLRPGDVIREWNGEPISEHSILFRYSLTTPPTTKVNLTVFRNGKEKTATLTVGRR